MIRSNKKSRNRGVSRSRLSTKLPFFSSALSSNSTNECCGKIVTYTPTSKEIKRKRGRGYGREKDDGEERETTRAREKRRGGEREFSPTRVHTLLHIGEKLRSSWRRDGFSRAAYTVRQTGPDRRKASFTSREKRATCGDNSIVHFIRSAALRYKYAYPLSSNSAGIKRGRGGGCKMG